MTVHDPPRLLHTTLKHTTISLPGCELSGHTRSFTFKVEEEDDAEHVLALTMVRGGIGCWQLVDLYLIPLLPLY